MTDANASANASTASIQAQQNRLHLPVRRVHKNRCPAAEIELHTHDIGSKRVKSSFDAIKPRPRSPPTKQVRHFILNGMQKTYLPLSLGIKAVNVSSAVS